MLIGVNDTINRLPDLGNEYLIDNARAFFNFNTITSDHLTTITQYDDLTGNGYDLINAPSGYSSTSPKAFNYKFANRSGLKSVFVRDTNPLSFENATTNSLFSTSHEIHVTFLYRGQNFNCPIFGVNQSEVYWSRILADMRLELYIKRATTTTLLRSTDPVFGQAIQNTDLGNLIYLRYRLNFSAGNEEAKTYINGVEIPMDLISGTAVSSWNSSYSWNNTNSFSFGAYAQSTNFIGTTAKDYWFYKIAVTDLLTQSQANLVGQSFLNDPQDQDDDVQFIADFEKVNFCTISKTFKIGVFCKTTGTVTIAGGSNITVSPTTLDFSSNETVPQLVEVVATKRYGFGERSLTFTKGSNTFVKNIRITESYSGTTRNFGSDYFLTDGYCICKRESDRRTYAEVSSSMIDFIFKGDYPSGNPESNSTISTSYSGVTLAHANLSSKTKYLFSEEDLDGWTYTNSVAWIRNSSPNNKLFIDFMGHGEAGHQSLYDDIMDLGYDYGIVDMGLIGSNTHNNPNIVSASWLAHNELYTTGVDREAYSGLRLHFFDKIRFLTWVLTQVAYDEIILCGVSGGGYSVGMLIPLITDNNVINKITKVFSVRGFCSQNHPGIGGDYEQGGDFYLENTNTGTVDETYSGPRVIQFFRDNPSLAIIQAASQVIEFHHMTHEDDQTGGGRRYPEIYEPELSMRGNYNLFVNDDAAQSTHGYQALDIQYILDNI